MTDLNINTFDKALLTLSNLDVTSSKINLLALANDNDLSLADIASSTAQLLNQLVENKNIVLAGFSYKDLLLTNRLSQAIKRHNQQIVWSYTRTMFDTDGQTSQLLSKVSLTNKGLVFKPESNKTVKVSSFTTLDKASDSLIGLSIKKDNGLLVVDIEPLKIDIEAMVKAYDNWVNSLKDVSLTIVSNSDNANNEPAQTIDLLPSPAIANLTDTVESLKLENENKNGHITHLKDVRVEQENLIQQLYKNLDTLYADLSKTKQLKHKDLIMGMIDNDSDIKTA